MLLGSRLAARRMAGWRPRRERRRMESRPDPPHEHDQADARDPSRDQVEAAPGGQLDDREDGAPTVAVGRHGPRSDASGDPGRADRARNRREPGPRWEDRAPAQPGDRAPRRARRRRPIGGRFRPPGMATARAGPRFGPEPRPALEFPRPAPVAPGRSRPDADPGFPGLRSGRPGAPLDTARPVGHDRGLRSTSSLVARLRTSCGRRPGQASRTRSPVHRAAVAGARTEMALLERWGCTFPRSPAFHHPTAEIPSGGGRCGLPRVLRQPRVIFQIVP
jgi:hypothetical protein